LGNKDDVGTIEDFGAATKEQTVHKVNVTEFVSKNKNICIY
jgi:hypothetical protein